MVAFGQLWGDKLVEDLGGLGERERVGGLGAGVERGAATAVGVSDEMALAFRFDGGVMHPVAGPLAEVGNGEIHWFHPEAG